MSRALVLSGGGAYGAFQVGAILRLVEAGHTWDVIAGVSVGALNGACLAQYGAAEQSGGALALRDLWLHQITGNRAVYVPWFFGRVMALWRGGLYNTAPLRKIVTTHFDVARVQASGVQLLVGAVGLESGQYRAIDATTHAADYVDWIMASAAMPALFPPVKIAGASWVDGGVRDTTPLRDVLVHAPDAIDVIVTGPVGRAPRRDAAPFTSVLQVAARSAGLLADEVFQTDLDLCAKLTVPVLRIEPAEHFTHDAFDFDARHIRNLIRHGYERAGAALDVTPRITMVPTNVDSTAHVE